MNKNKKNNPTTKINATDVALTLSLVFKILQITEKQHHYWKTHGESA